MCATPDGLFFLTSDVFFSFVTSFPPSDCRRDDRSAQGWTECLSNILELLS